MPSRLTSKESAELLKHTPMKTENDREKRAREKAHREIVPAEQPYMVVFFGLLSYGVVWIGNPGGAEATAEKEMAWWQEKVDRGLEVLPFTRRPDKQDFMVRQQWDLDALTSAILRSYDS